MTAVSGSELVGLLHALYKAGSATRSQALQGLDAGKRTTQAALQHLIDSGLAVEMRGPTQGVGRPATYIQLSPEVAYSVGISIDLARSRAVITTANGEIVHVLEEEPLALDSGDRLPAAITEIYERVVNSARVPMDKVLALGVSFGGFLDDVEGTISAIELALIANGRRMLWPEGTWLSMPLAEQLSEMSGLNVVVEDRPRAASFGEKRFGAAQDSDNFVFLYVGWQDISAGLFMNGQVYRGARGVSGEIGHVVVRSDGPVCRCGNRGCLEVMSSGRAMLEGVLAGLGNGIESSLSLVLKDEATGLTPNMVVEAAISGDKLCCQVVHDAARHLGSAAAGLVNIFGPNLIVLGGLAASADGLFLHPVRDAVRLRALQMMARHVRVVESTIGPWGTARAAAILGLEKAFGSAGCLKRIIG